MSRSTEHIASTANLHKEISHLRHELKTATESHPASSERIRIGDYLIERLIHLGVTVRRPPRNYRRRLLSKLSFGRPSLVFRGTSILVSVFTPPNRRQGLTAMTNRILGMRVIFGCARCANPHDMLSGPCGRQPKDSLGRKLVSEAH